MKSRRPLLTLLLLAASALAATSCSVARAYVSVAQGNAAYERGSYQQATVDYLNAAKSGVHPAWISYDLANVYHALGEPEGASVEWKKAEGATDRRLVAATAFNKGLLAYELGHYREAYDSFRKVLELNPGDIDAKIDLELSFQKMQNREPPQRAATIEPVAVKQNRSQVENLLNLIRQKEDNYWVPPKPQKERSSGPDW